MSGFIYLATPYSHPSARVRCERYWAAIQKAADIMASGQAVFCPIGHSHPIAEHLPSELAYDFDFWMRIDLPILRKARELWVYQLEGWTSSRGVQREIEEAVSIQLPIRYIR